MFGTRGLIVLVDVDLAAVIGLDADRFHAQVLGIAGAAVGPQQDVGLDLLAALQLQRSPRCRRPSTRSYSSLCRSSTPLLAEVVAERVDDLLVQERQQLVARVDQIDLEPACCGTSTHTRSPPRRRRRW